MMDYYYGLEADADIYFTIPKLLFTHDYYKSMSCEAKVLYGLCLDRMRLSQRNGWFDAKNRVYIIYPIDRICDDLGCSNKTAVKWMSELEAYGLLEKQRLGRGKASLLYVKKCSGVLTDEDRKKHCRKDKSPVQESTPSPAVYKKPVNEAVKPMAEDVPKSKQLVQKKTEREMVREAFKKQISYDELQTQSDGKLAAKILEVAVDMLMLPEDKEISIQGANHTAAEIHVKMKELKKEHILYVIDSIKGTEKPVKNMMKYLQTSLYNAATTYDFYAASKENVTAYEDYIHKDDNKLVGKRSFTESQIFEETPAYYFVSLSNGKELAVPKADVHEQDGIYTFDVKHKLYQGCDGLELIHYDMHGILPMMEAVTHTDILACLKSPEDIVSNESNPQNVQQTTEQKSPEEDLKKSQKISEALANQAIRKMLEKATGRNMNNILNTTKDTTVVKAD